jgi:hypothetical protein
MRLLLLVVRNFRLGAGVSKVRHFTAAQHGMPCAFAFQESPQNPQLARGIAIDHRTIDKVSAIFWWNWPTGPAPTSPKIG